MKSTFALRARTGVRSERERKRQGFQGMPAWRVQVARTGCQGRERIVALRKRTTVRRVSHSGNAVVRLAQVEAFLHRKHEAIVERITITSTRNQVERMQPDAVRDVHGCHGANGHTNTERSGVCALRKQVRVIYNMYASFPVAPCRVSCPVQHLLTARRLKRFHSAPLLRVRSLAANRRNRFAFSKEDCLWRPN